jgi:hypothetical protein
MKASNSYSKLDYAEQPTLFIEFHGSEAAVAEQVELVKAIAADYGGGEFRWSVKPEERTKLWQARHDAYYAGMSMRPGSKGWPTDVCVPISRLADCIVETRKDIEASGLMAMILGHVGDGNFHTTIRWTRTIQLSLSAPRLQRPAGRPCARDGRHLHRRARHRLRQDRLSGTRARRGCWLDAADQADARSRESDEPGEDF